VPPPPLNLSDPDSVIASLQSGTRANLSAPCRVKGIDVIDPPGTLIATGDLNDNPVNFQKLVAAAGMTMNEPGLESAPRRTAPHAARDHPPTG
jgi:hypothetical protein